MIMKQKFLLIGFLVIFICAAFAFTQKTSTPSIIAGELWFEYIGGDVSQSGSYSLYGDGSVSPNCPGGQTRCAVKAQPQSGDPSLPNMSTVIQTANKQ